MKITDEMVDLGVSKAAEWGPQPRQMVRAILTAALAHMPDVEAIQQKLDDANQALAHFEQQSASVEDGSLCRDLQQRVRELEAMLPLLVGAPKSDACLNAENNTLLRRVWNLEHEIRLLIRAVDHARQALRPPDTAS